VIDAGEVYIFFNGSAEKHLTHIHSIKWCKFVWSSRDVLC
jgi:hypothetical protein